MSDEKVDNVQPEKPSVIMSQETPQENKQQEKPPEVIKQVDFSESAIKNAGDQGVFFNPSVGISTPDPFVSQDIAQPPSLPAQIIIPPAQSSGGKNSSGEE